MKVFVSVLVSSAILLLYGFFLAPWLFSTLHGAFENSDLGTLVGIVGILLTAGPAGVLSLLAGVATAAAFD